jgi:hypothetical protein
LCTLPRSETEGASGYCVGGRVVDEKRSPIQHTIVLRRIEREQNVARFYALMIKRDLIGCIVRVRQWSRIGTRGQEHMDPCPEKPLRLKP